MSALQRQTYANQFQPLFQPAGGGGGGTSLTLDTLNINQGGEIKLGSSVNIATNLVFNKALDGSTTSTLSQGYIGAIPPNQALSVQDQVGDYDALQVGNVYVYGLGAVYGSPNYMSLNSSTGVGLSYGTLTSRTDYMNLTGGVLTLTSNMVGPVPVSFVSTTVSVSPVPTSPAAFGDFLIAPLYPTTSGQEYDVCCKGTIALASGTPDPTIPDLFVVKVVVGGTGNGTQTYIFNPNNGIWSVRDRLISNATTPSIVVGVQNIQQGTSTAVYDCTMTMGDVVRVK